MKKTYVLIDHENVQPEAVAALDRELVHIMVFVGASQSKVAFDMAAVLQPMGPRASYCKIAGNGPNALDFHIAFYIGHLAATEPDAAFYIVSKDTGFDPLLEHLKSRKITAGRVKSTSDLPFLRTATTGSPPGRIPAGRTSAARISPNRTLAVAAALRQLGASKPGTLKRLGNLINGRFQKTLSEAEIDGIISELRGQGILEITQQKVTYPETGGEAQHPTPRATPGDRVKLARSPS
jgi:hypothetical protein